MHVAAVPGRPGCNYDGSNSSSDGRLELAAGNNGRPDSGTGSTSETEIRPTSLTDIIAAIQRANEHNMLPEQRIQLRHNDGSWRVTRSSRCFLSYEPYMKNIRSIVVAADGERL